MTRWRKFVCWARGHKWLHASREACTNMHLMGGIFSPRVCLRCLRVESGFPYPASLQQSYRPVEPKTGFELLEKIAELDQNFAKKLAEPL